MALLTWGGEAALKVRINCSKGYRAVDAAALSVEVLLRHACLHCGCVLHRYVQCYDCGNPETIVKIKKEFIYLKCKACG